ncbi:MAG: zinc ribbon domain-containing protein, partial [Treponema sp.]|nr:zinc ribbon domain-containing protein [Treponema sp.]
MKELARFCSRCGSKLINKAVVCVKCGYRVPADVFQSNTSGVSSLKINKKVILGIYGVSSAIGVFSGLVPAIGIIIVGICFNFIYAGLIFLIVGLVYFLIQRGLFGWAFIIFGFTISLLVTLHTLGLIGDITTFIQKVRTFSF